MAKTVAQLQEDYNAALAQIDGFTTEIAGDLSNVSQQIQDLQAQIAAGNVVTAAQLQPMVDALNARSAALEAVAGSADALVPPTPPPVPAPVLPSASTSTGAPSGSVATTPSESASASEPAPTTGFPAGLVISNGFLVTPAGLPVYMFSGDASSVDPAAWTALKDDSGVPVLYTGEQLYTFTGDQPNVLPPTGDGGDGGAWAAVRAA